MASAYTWDPVNPLFEDIELVEFIGTTGTVVNIIPRIPVALPGLPDNYTINSVTCVSDPAPSDLVINISGDHFTIISTFSDMFNRTIKYLVQDQDLTTHYYTTNKFENIPANFTGVYEYTPPPDDYMDVLFAVNVTGSISGNFTANFKVNLRHDWAASNAQLVTLANAGTGVIE